MPSVGQYQTAARPTCLLARPTRHIAQLPVHTDLLRPDPTAPVARQADQALGQLRSADWPDCHIALQHPGPTVLVALLAGPWSGQCWPTDLRLANQPVLRWFPFRQLPGQPGLPVALVARQVNQCPYRPANHAVAAAQTLVELGPETVCNLDSAN